VFSNEDWEGDKILPSNEEYINFCENQEKQHTEVKCIVVDAIKDETVRPLMKKSNILKDNTPCVMVHQGGKGKWYYGPGALDLTEKLIKTSIH